MKKSNIAILLVTLLSVLGAGLFFKDNLLKVYDNFDGNLQNFQRIDFRNIISEVKRDIFAPTPLNVGGRETQALLVKAKVIAETNAQRYNNGLLPPLIENVKLSEAAKAKANDMFKNQYFEHVSPDLVDPGQLVKNFGYAYIVAGENLILGNFESEKEMVQLWMDSPGHRANILNDRFTEIGVAVVKGFYQSQTVWIGVQEFGFPLSSCGEPSETLKDQIDANKASLDQLSFEIDEKRTQVENTSKRSPEYNDLANEYNQLVSEYNSLVQETKALIEQYNNQVDVFNQCVAS